MHRLLRTLAAPATVILTAALAATVAGAPASAAPTTTIKPAALPRGADVSIPHLEQKTVVDGAVRIRIKAPVVRLLGKSGGAYVVGTANRMGGHGRVFRVQPDGTRTQLARASIYQSQLSDDGVSIVSTRFPRNRTTVLTARSATTGATIASRSVRGYASVLDADAGRVLLGTDHETLLWSTGDDSLQRVARSWGYAGDLSADVIAGFNKDPYLGGCTVLRRLSTGERLWRSCQERVTEFDADGSRMATVDILADGLGPGYVAVRSTTGHRYGAYRVHRGWFGEIHFETPTALLLEANGPRKAATVRCTDTGCERASDLRKAEQP